MWFLVPSGLPTFLTLGISNYLGEHPFAQMALLFLIASIKRNSAGIGLKLSILKKSLAL